jgi:glycosyltransferase involved in cell wall biosynthesis
LEVPFEALRRRLHLKKVRKLNGRLVSVIIPAFNAAEHIRQTLDSVLAQTYQALEVIVVDDGSTDATGAIAEEFVKKDARVQLVRQRNAGVGAARNAAIRKARGEYIAPLDADDFWFPEKLEKQVARLEQYGEETGLVYCWSRQVDKDGDFVAADSPKRLLEGRLRHALVLSNIIDNASVPLFRAATLSRVGLYLTRTEQGGAQGCEDWDLYIRIAETFNIRVVPEILAAYRQTSSSMRVNAESMEKSFAVVMQRVRQRNRDLPTAYFRWSAGYFYVYLLEICDLWGHYSWSFRCLMKAVCANPFYLLKAWIYKKLIVIQLNAIMGPTWKKFVKQVRPSSAKKGQEADLHSKKDKKRPFISSGIFNRIEDNRWAAALHDGD